MPAPYRPLEHLNSRFALAYAGLQLTESNTALLRKYVMRALAPWVHSATSQGMLLAVNVGIIVGLRIVTQLAFTYVHFYWTEQGYRTAQQHLLKTLEGRPRLWNEDGPRDFALNELMSGALSLAGQTVSTTEMMISLVAELASGVVQLMLVPWSWPLMTVGIGAALAARFLSTYIDGNIGETEELRAATNDKQTLERSFWDHWGIDNRALKDQWKDRFDRQVDRFFQEGYKSRRGSTLVMLQQSVLWLLPIALQQSAAFERQNLGGRPQLLTEPLLEQLTGLCNIVGATFLPNPLMQSIKTVRGRHETTRNAYRRLLGQDPDLVARIQFDALSLKRAGAEDEAKSIDEALRLLSEPGLYRLQGPNGRGKSSLLLECKHRLGGLSFFLPAKSALDMGHNDMSTGQQVVADFSWIEQLAKKEESPNAFFFDEWNANLDGKNEEKVRQVIERLAAKHAVLEVVHHQDS